VIAPSRGFAGTVRLTTTKLPYRAPLQVEFLETGPSDSTGRTLRLGSWVSRGQYNITIEQISHGSADHRGVVESCLLSVSEIRKKLGFKQPSTSLVLVSWRSWNWVEFTTNGKPFRIFYRSCKDVEVSGG
jgi:hypothetical protein